MSAAGRVLAAVVGGGDKLPRASQGGDLHPPPEPARAAAPAGVQPSHCRPRHWQRGREKPRASLRVAHHLVLVELGCVSRGQLLLARLFSSPTTCSRWSHSCPFSSVITASPCLALHHASVIWGKKAHFPLNGHQGCLLAHLSDGLCVWYTCL